MHVLGLLLLLSHENLTNSVIIVYIRAEISAIEFKTHFVSYYIRYHRMFRLSDSL